MLKQLPRLNADETFDTCSRFWAVPDAQRAVQALFEEAYRSFDEKVLVLDDDPTGIQTVHDVDVVTDWRKETLQRFFESDERLCFVLTNSRSFSSERTCEAHREIALNAAGAEKASGQRFVLVSRGDSTLRGHYPLETEVLRTALEERGAAFDGEWFCPFFREGGRFTLDGVHYVREGDELVPAAQTEFARDKTFGYAHSNLPGYLEEKSGGRIAAGDVLVVTLRELRSLQLDQLVQRIASAEGFRYIVSDALEESDVMVMATVLLRLMSQGRRYLIRSAAAVPKVLGHISDRTLLSRDELSSGDASLGGLVIVGSHVKKTTEQLSRLRQSAARLEWIEFRTGAWQESGGLKSETRRCAALAEEAIRRGSTAVVYTSRTLVAPEGASAEELLSISVRISDALTAVVSSLHIRPRFLIAKGGITSSDVGVKALRVSRARVMGQAQPGVPVWKTGEESLFPGLSYIIFPGNVGTADTLRAIVDTLS